MKQSERFAVIMAGGRGERFWPLSTSRRPKQLLDLVGDRPLIAQAVERLQGLVAPENVFVITGAELTDAVREAVPELPPENVVGEPMGRDTAAAVVCGAALVKARAPEGVFAVLTADHVMGDEARFREVLCGGLELAAEQDVLVTIGIEPTFPSEGFGYIETGEPFAASGPVEFFRAIRFVEKPDRETARRYLDSGRFYWNSGMFVWSVPTLEKAFRVHRPQLAELLERLAAAAAAGRVEEEMARRYPALEKISIDYALMEKADNIVTARGDFGWDDVGSWPALAGHFPADEEGNTFIGTVRSLDAKGNLVFSRDRLTALIGVKDLVVVQAEGVTLICPKDRAQEIKQLVQRLREEGGFEKLL